MAGERLVKMINDCKTPESHLTDLVYGRVTSTSPLTIRLNNGEELSGSFLMLSQMVQDYIIEIDVPTVSTTTGQVNNVTLDGNRPNVDADVDQIQVVTNVNVGSERQKIQIFRSLSFGDEVRIIKCHKSQKYFVIERGGR